MNYIDPCVVQLQLCLSNCVVAVNLSLSDLQEAFQRHLEKYNTFS